MNAYSLPTSVRVGDREVPIRTDFRAVLDVIAACRDPALDAPSRAWVTLAIMFPGFPDGGSVAAGEVAEALAAVMEFVGYNPAASGASDAGESSADAEDVPASTPELFDWEADAGLIIPEINRAAGCDVRALPYLHWWSFLSYFFSIFSTDLTGGSLLRSVIGIRQKRASGVRLEPWESEFYRQHGSLFRPRGGGWDAAAKSKEEREILEWLS